MANYLQIVNSLLPIYQRVHNPRIKRKLHATQMDVDLAKSRLTQNENSGRLENAGRWLAEKTPKNIIFIGDSHITHLKNCKQHTAYLISKTSS